MSGRKLKEAPMETICPNCNKHDTIYLRSGGALVCRACFRAGHCVEHDRPLEVCGRLAWADYGQLLFDNCVRDE